MILIAAKYLIPKGYTAITLYPFIIVRNKQLAANAVLINHECIHLRQQAELLVIPFYLWYLSEYLIRLLYFKNHNKAYRAICFEKEAYTHDKNPGYLSKRPFWNFRNYL